MTQTYFPFSEGQGANVTEIQWSKMAQHWLRTGVLQGVFNNFNAFGDSSGMQIKVSNGAAWIKGHYFESDAEEALPIAPADPANPRIDRVVIRLDWATDTISLAVLQGTAKVGPVPPALTQNTSRWEISLAKINVNAGGVTITATDVVDERIYARLSTFFSAYQSTPQSIAAGVWTKALFQTEEFDHLGEYYTLNSTFTAREQGVYFFSASCYIGTQSQNNETILSLYVNGVERRRLSQNSIGGTSKNGMAAGGTLMKLNSGDVVEVYVRTETADDTTVGSNVTYFNGVKLA